MASTTIAGSGWLRTAGFGSSTARYNLTMSDDRHLSGEVCGEMATMIEAASLGRATLVLESGRTVRVDVLHRSQRCLSVHVDDADRPAAFAHAPC